MKLLIEAIKDIEHRINQVNSNEYHEVCDEIWHEGYLSGLEEARNIAARVKFNNES